ncbi:MAG: hypothetical protein R2729_20455 [Bryobacteraceae bacterium]
MDKVEPGQEFDVERVAAGECRRVRRAPPTNAGVVDWLRVHERELAVCPAILGELRFGILRRPRGRKRTMLERWFESGAARLHYLAWDVESGLQWAELLACLRLAGRAMPVKVSLIAATALLHDLTVVTRNRADFLSSGVRIANPFSD